MSAQPGIDPARPTGPAEGRSAPQTPPRGSRAALRAPAEACEPVTDTCICGGKLDITTGAADRRYVGVRADVLLALLDERDADTALLRRLQWCKDVWCHGEEVGGCPVCNNCEVDGHAPDCALGARLAGAG